MTTRELRQHIGHLASLEKTAAPVVSSYIDVEAWKSGNARVLDDQARALKRELPSAIVRDFEEALARTDVFLGTALLPQTRGVAVFARGGEQPVFFSLQFRVPVINRISVDDGPLLGDLEELQDTYYRALLRAGWTARWDKSAAEKEMTFHEE